MNYIINLTYLAIIVAISSCCLTRILIIIMPKFGIIDIPSARRAHSKTTPRGGGLAFVLIFSIALPVFEYIRSGSCSESITLLQIFLPISFISLLDDISHVPVPIRLFVHIICAYFAIKCLVHPNNILHYEISMKWDLAIGTIALLSFLNVYNFLDGIDGITVNESIHLSFTILVLCILRYGIIPKVDIIIVTSVIILSWSLVFVFFNKQPASIFLGDVGSISLGFLLGVCLLIIASASARLFLACVIAALYYIADGGITILIRLVKGEKIWKPHLQHFFQRAVQKGLAHKEVVERIMQCNAVLMLFSINALFYPVMSIICAMLVVMVTLIRLVL